LNRKVTARELRKKLASELDLPEEEYKNDFDRAINLAINSLFLNGELGEKPSLDPTENETAEESDSESSGISSSKDLPKKAKKQKSAAKETKITKNSKKEMQLDRLKAYVNKCGVRKVWKKELDGLNARKSIEKVNQILQDLGMEGMLILLY
jgi:hypothetical protein